MLDLVTIPFIDATFFPAHDTFFPLGSKQPTPTTPVYMLATAMTTRRTPNSALSKADISDRNLVTPPNGAGHWRLNSSGQLVESSDWDLADEIVKLQISGENKDTQVRTSPRSKIAPFGPVSAQESSPLDTASQTSLESASTNPLNQTVNLASHSRESSADTTGSHGSALSSNSQTLRAPPVTPLKVGAVGESRNRPHSYSGGLSSTDLIRLQQAGGSPGHTESWSSPNGTPERQQPQAEQLTYPSLLGSHNGPGSRLAEPPLQQSALPRPQDELQNDFQIQQQPQFNLMGHNVPPLQAGAPGHFVHGRPPNVATNIPYRQQPPRAFNPAIPPVVPSPTNFGAYPGPVHHGAMPVGGPQQDMYNMMLPTPPLENPTMARLQQQSGVFQRTHQHSASDPASLRDPATLALLNNAFAAGQMYAPAMGPPPALSMFANQFYGAPTEPYPSPELAAAQMMARLQAQYTGPYGVPLPTQSLNLTNTGSSVSTNNSTGTGPSANNRKLGLYKTELCRSWEEKGSCRYGAKCQFAHGEEELRKVQRHPKYKTEICRRCCFIHTELPANGPPPGADGTPPPSNPDGRARSSSTNSDPNDVSSSSLLARITAKRKEENAMNSGSGSLSTTPPSAGFQVNGRPDHLRVNTNVTDPAVITKQNKSAYPTFAHNGVIMPATEEPTARSPGPVTAGPDFGRHASSRLEIVGSQRGGPKTAINPSVRHSFNGSEIPLDLSHLVTPTNTTPTTAQLNASPEAPKVSRINGHVRSGSAGNWATATRGNSSHLAAYPLSSIPGGELKTNSPWAEYGVGSRLAEKNWA
ncbi:hypothetical protein BN946_scf184942.g59 [Trametes cinnabarina]|uniref:C3H1-type domain-containing protein n=1 Tax=Pycnoporus cinnabarinus TaxID=5643 RepID=A0A060SDA4_PYCCI|nr:hypothetical protein BN946_scf184942.g59 [Trametes cinnabarina]